jgi:L-fuculose-phosphate aldolase
VTDTESGTERRLRLALVAAGARLAAAGLILPGEGNLSVRLDAGTLLLTPAGADKGRLRAIDVVRLPVGEAPPTKVSTEVRLHQAVYAARPEVGAVVHAHPPHLLALSLRGERPDWKMLLETQALLGPVAAVGPHAPGSEELAAGVATGLASAGACVLERHGAVTVGGTLDEAMLRMLLLERVAALAPRSA